MAFSTTKAANKRKAGNDGRQANTKRMRIDYKDTILNFYGDEDEPFSVHKDFITARSPFFHAACSDRWIEGQQKTVGLPCHSPEVFRVYLDWVYRDELTVDTLYEKDVYKGSDRAAIYQLSVLRLYCVADYLLRRRALQAADDPTGR